MHSELIPFVQGCEEELQLHPQHVRKLLKQGKLPKEIHPITLTEGGHRKYWVAPRLWAYIAKRLLIPA